MHPSASLSTCKEFFEDVGLIHTMTCSSNEVPTAESFALVYQEFKRAILLVCERDLVLI